MQFYKYQGTGNDFVLIDQRFRHTIKRSDRACVAQICDRRFGVGADGLILLQKHPKFDFEMIYFNSDGGESSMCGNGGRCIAAFAQHLGLFSDKCSFLAIDGPHDALVQTSGKPFSAWVELKMSDVGSLEKNAENDWVLNTGSPHYVHFIDKIGSCNIVDYGKSIRYNSVFKAEGINVNVVEKKQDGLTLLTYERGVEDETLSCGTGVTAAVLAAHFSEKNVRIGSFETKVKAKGGNLSVRFTVQNEKKITDIWLCGPAERVFTGRIDV